MFLLVPGRRAARMVARLERATWDSRTAEYRAMTERIAKIAGEALVKIKGTAVDAAVMASAAQRADVVYTSDPRDLGALRMYFPSVKVMRATGSRDLG
jgi:hypothetical protein